MHNKFAKFSRAALLGLALSGLAAGAAQAQIPMTSGLTQDPQKVLPGLYNVEPNHTRITWSVNHHGFSTFSAVLPVAAGTLQLNAPNIDGTTVNVTVDMTKASSGIPIFDEHMDGPNIFNLEKFPTSSFKSTKIERTGDRTALLTGDLTYLGVTKPVTFNVTFHQAGTGRSGPGYRIGFDAVGKIKRSEFGHTTMATIGDDVDLKIEAEFLHSNPPAQ